MYRHQYATGIINLISPEHFAGEKGGDHLSSCGWNVPEGRAALAWLTGYWRAAGREKRRSVGAKLAFGAVFRAVREARQGASGSALTSRSRLDLRELGLEVRQCPVEHRQLTAEDADQRVDGW